MARIPSLQKGATYRLNLRIALSDSSHFATDGLGALFTTYGSPDTNTLSTILTTPQVDYSSYGVISDTVNWTLLSSTFVADSAYTTIIIGGFKKAVFMHVTPIKTFGPDPLSSAYYYIDSVSLVKTDSPTAIHFTSLASNTVHISPNPLHDKTTLTYSNPYHDQHTLLIYSATGVLIKTIKNIVDENTTIDCSELVKGLYYYQLKDGVSLVEAGKLEVY